MEVEETHAQWASASFSLSEPALTEINSEPRSSVDETGAAPEPEPPAPVIRNTRAPQLWTQLKQFSEGLSDTNQRCATLQRSWTLLLVGLQNIGPTQDLGLSAHSLKRMTRGTRVSRGSLDGSSTPIDSLKVILSRGMRPQPSGLTASRSQSSSISAAPTPRDTFTPSQASMSTMRSMSMRFPGRGAGRGSKEDSISDGLLDRADARAYILEHLTSYSPAEVKQHIVDTFASFDPPTEASRPKDETNAKKAALSSLGRGFLTLLGLYTDGEKVEVDSDHVCYELGYCMQQLVRSAVDPTVQKLPMPASSFCHKPLRPAELLLCRYIVMDVVEQVLYRIGEWDPAMKELWTWFLGRVMSSYVQTFDPDMETAFVVHHTWQRVVGARLLPTVINHAFGVLFGIAPEVQKMFSRKANVLDTAFIKAAELVVCYIGSPDCERMKARVTESAMNHLYIPFDREGIEVLRQSLILGLKRTLGNDVFTPEVRAQWIEAFAHTAAIYEKVLDERTGVCAAVASRSVAQVEKALSEVPRAHRARQALEVVVGSHKRPLLSACLEMGSLKVAEALIRDLLAIRTDRETYYCGRILLWDRHPNFVEMLASKAPQLIGVFLDGHMWTSGAVESGSRRVNFYIRELWGNPNERNVFDSPLGQMVFELSEAYLHCFSHPVIEFVVDLKWKLIGYGAFLKRVVVNLLKLTVTFTYLWVDHPETSLCLGFISVLLSAVSIWRIISVMVRQALGGRTLKMQMLPIKVPYVLQGFGILDLLCSIMVVVLFGVSWWSDALCWTQAFARQPHYYPYASRISWWGSVAGFTTMLLTLHVAIVFKFSRQLSMVFYAIQAVLIDVVWFMMLIVVWVVAFGCLIYWPLVGHRAEDGLSAAAVKAMLADEEGLTDGRSQQTVTYLLLLTSMGMYDPNLFTDNQPWFVRIALVACMFMSVLVLINLLVSSMVSKYDQMHVNYYELAIKSRAFECLQAEDACSTKQRKKVLEGLHLEEPCGFDTDSRGPIGAIQVRLQLEQLSHPAYGVLDRVERYTGTAGASKPWDAKDLVQRLDGDDDRTQLSKELAEIREQLDLVAHACERNREMLASYIEANTPAAEGGEEEEGEKVVSAEELAKHNTKESAWLAIDEYVYDITTFMETHPGGLNLLLRKSGRDASKLFKTAHPDLPRAYRCLGRQIKIGPFVP